MTHASRLILPRTLNIYLQQQLLRVLRSLILQMEIKLLRLLSQVSSSNKLSSHTAINILLLFMKIPKKKVKLEFSLSKMLCSLENKQKEHLNIFKLLMHRKITILTTWNGDHWIRQFIIAQIEADWCNMMWLSAKLLVLEMFTDKKYFLYLSQRTLLCYWHAAEMEPASFFIQKLSMKLDLFNLISHADHALLVLFMKVLKTKNSMCLFVAVRMLKT